jgi:hypothetical protein
MVFLNHQQGAILESLMIYGNGRGTMSFSLCNDKRSFVPPPSKFHPRSSVLCSLRNMNPWTFLAVTEAEKAQLIVIFVFAEQGDGRFQSRWIRLSGKLDPRFFCCLKKRTMKVYFTFAFAPSCTSPHCNVLVPNIRS